MDFDLPAGVAWNDQWDAVIRLSSGHFCFRQADERPQTYRDPSASRRCNRTPGLTGAGVLQHPKKEEQNYDWDGNADQPE